MKKSVVFFLHVGVWLCYLIVAIALMGAFFQGNENVEDARLEKAFKVILFFALLPSVITFYTFYFVLFPKYFKQKKYVFSIVYGFVVALKAALVGYFFLYLLHGKECVNSEDGSFLGIVFFMSFISFISGIIAFVIQGFITWFSDLKLKEALTQKNHQMELALVKSQLDPHFLFNTINNIDILILKDQEKASAYLNKLSDIMRFMLFETKADEILLEKEIEYIQKYIQLQKIRTSNPDYVQFEILGNYKGKTIAPMVFIPFIENAFKHTTNKKWSEAVVIKIYIQKNEVVLECVNKFDSTRKSKKENSGLGNGLIRKRLDLIYADNYILEVTKYNEQYSVKLTIKDE